MSVTMNKFTMEFVSLTQKLYSSNKLVVFLPPYTLIHGTYMPSRKSGNNLHTDPTQHPRNYSEAKA